MEKSEQLNELAKALGAFQGEVEAVKKDAINPFFKSKYASLENILETIRPALKKNKLAFTQFPAGENELITILIHESGQFLKASFKMSPKDNTPQGQGSAITYARRYAISAVLGIATEEDDDGNVATVGQGKTQNPKTTKTSIPVKKSQDGADLSQIPLSQAQNKKIFAQLKQLGKTKEEFEEWIKRVANIDGIENLNIRQASKFIESMEKMAKGEPEEKQEESLEDLFPDHE